MKGRTSKAEFLEELSPASERGVLEVLVLGCVYSQLSISREQVCVSRGNLLKSMLHIAVTVTLEIKGQVLRACLRQMQDGEAHRGKAPLLSSTLTSGKTLRHSMLFTVISSVYVCHWNLYKANECLC